MLRDLNLCLNKKYAAVITKENQKLHLNIILKSFLDQVT